MKTFDRRILAQHVAIVGKTGSGKTCTAKLAIEQVVAEGARVCILDPIKSDWWGLTSSADGKRPGLPFHILGGPRGHVPLHAQAGAAIGEIVASGALPLSILDMSDFAMGGLQKFFTQFAPVLIQKMRGVLYLVIEESHEFAPKERGGFEAENMAIHYAKKLAVAGRSKGIRLIIATQRTQALHNALLGSCDTLIAHRLISPADQEPVVKWLKANLPTEKAKEVAASLQSLKTGEAWICSGEVGLFERHQFERIHTYDNTATPTEDAARIEVKTAPVDQEKLRSIIGTAVDEAKANDPAELKKHIATLKVELAKKPAAMPAPPLPPQEIPVFTADERSMMRAIATDVSHISETLANFRANFAPIENRIAALHERIDHVTKKCVITPRVRTMTMKSHPNFKMPAGPHAIYRNAPEGVGRAGLAILAAVNSRHPKASSRAQAAILSGYSIKSSSFSNALSSLRTAGFINGQGDAIETTDAGLNAVPVMAPASTEELRQRWLQKLGAAPRRMLEMAIANPGGISREDIASLSGYSLTSSSFTNALSELRTLELISGGSRGEPIQPSESLFG